MRCGTGVGSDVRCERRSRLRDASQPLTLRLEGERPLSLLLHGD
jgi:hypothetical protein